MDVYRLKHTLRLCLSSGSLQRARYIRKHNIFAHMGEDSHFMPRVIPLYPKLISIGKNVCIASGVLFCTHDAIHLILNHTYHTDTFKENKGCIIIGDNCFIGARTVILPGVKIGNNCIIGAGSLVVKDIPSNEVWGGVPAKKIKTFEEFVKERSLLAPECR